jgi:uncharacterized phage infection (PIP) family protein YhgE
VGSQEQARGIEQIAKAVTQMQRVTQSTAASAEQSASAGEEMSAQASGLNSAARLLQELIGGVEQSEPKAASFSNAPSGRSVGTLQAARRRARAVKAPEQVIPLDDDFRSF